MLLCVLLLLILWGLGEGGNYELGTCIIPVVQKKPRFTRWCSLPTTSQMKQELKRTSPTLSLYSIAFSSTAKFVPTSHPQVLSPTSSLFSAGCELCPFKNMYRALGLLRWPPWKVCPEENDSHVQEFQTPGQTRRTWWITTGSDQADPH